MKKHHQVKLLIFICTLLSFNINAQTKKLKVERNHSSVNFTLPIANGITAIQGMFTDFAIEMDIENNDFTTAKISATIQAKSINTGIPDRDDHLRTTDFFDVEKYPEITFKSTKVIQVKDKNYLAKGIVEMHGIAKEMEIPFIYNGELGKNTLGFSATFSLNRLDFNIAKDFTHDTIPNFLGNEVKVEIDFWTKKRKDEKK